MLPQYLFTGVDLTCKARSLSSLSPFFHCCCGSFDRCTCDSTSIHSLRSGGSGDGYKSSVTERVLSSTKQHRTRFAKDSHRTGETQCVRVYRTERVSDTICSRLRSHEAFWTCLERTKEARGHLTCHTTNLGERQHRREKTFAS